MKKRLPVFVLLVLLVAVVPAAGCRPRSQVIVVTATPSPVPSPAPTAEPTPRPTVWRPEAPAEACQPSETRTCRVLFVLPESSYAYWAVNLPEEFEEAGYAVDVASRAQDVVSPCGTGIRDMPVDLALADVDVTEYDGVIYVGGNGCRSQWDDEEAHRIAREAVERGKVLGAGGCAPTILAHAGVLEGKRVAMCMIPIAVKNGQDYCQVVEELGAICVRSSIVRDGQIITARQKSYTFVPGILETMLLEAP